jgi:hypothetical protein
LTICCKFGANGHDDLEGGELYAPAHGSGAGT